MKYLGIAIDKPKVGFFGFTGCEGCQLQIANKEETLGDLLGAIEVKNFRLISSDKSDEYQIAFVEGSITTEEEVARLKRIRAQARILVAMGACACLGGVHNLRSRFSLEDTVQAVYGDGSVESGPVAESPTWSPSTSNYPAVLSPSQNLSGWCGILSWASNPNSPNIPCV